ncbi:MAG: ferric iron uptake transcriptional regulator [Granulosicoccus sp.]
MSQDDRKPVQFVPELHHTHFFIVALRVESLHYLVIVRPMKQNTANTDLKKAGLKVTLPRVSILGILEEAEQHHMSAEDVYKTLLKNGNEIGLATVYRVLTQFEAAGLVTRHHFDGGQAIFELDTGDNHDHIVCLKTGKVAEFKDPVIEARLEQIATDLGYTLNDHKIVLYGEVIETPAKKNKPRLQVRSAGPKRSR